MSGESYHTSLSPMWPEIRRAAADWLSRRDAGLTDDEENDFAAWLEADERHAQAFAEASAAWDALDSVQLICPAAGEVDPDLLVRPSTAQANRSGWRPIWFAVPALAAAAVVLGLFLRPTTIRHEPSATLTEVAATRLGDVREITLPDGSKVHLNTDTLVEAKFTPEERRVLVTRGEAHFNVAPNAQRPFIVTARHVAVRAVGTAFNVWLDAEKVEVLVTEGKVAITAPRATPSPAENVKPPSDLNLVAGERAVIPTHDDKPTADTPLVAPVAADEAERLLAWREQRLEFVSAPLTEVVAQFNRYNQHKLTIDPDATGLGEVKFGGGFRSDAHETFVRLLESNFGVKAERRESETILRRAQ